MHAKRSIHRLAVHGAPIALSSSTPGKAYPICPANVLISLLISVFLGVTTAPRFGTIWHAHEQGHTAHTHPHLTAASHPHHDDHQGPHGLPFGGHYAHATAHPDHHVGAADTSSQPAYTGWIQANRHGHFYALCFPPGTVVMRALASPLYCFSHTVFPFLSRRSNTLLGMQPRAPPVGAAALHFFV